MMRKYKVKLNLILGVLTGFLLYQIIIGEGYAILAAKQQIGGSSVLLLQNGESFLKIFAFAVFIGTILIFNTKKMRSINFNRISIYLLLTIITSILAGIEIVLLITKITVKVNPDIITYVSSNYFLSINLVYILLFLGVGTFLCVFLFLVNRKVKYIKLLTKEIKVIKDEGFGKTIEVIGQDELAQLCESINTMSIELRKKIDRENIIEKNKNELITGVSHDLRTPLTSIIGYIDLIKNNGYINEEKSREYMNIIDDKAKNLNKLINELFEYTKLSSHDIKLNYSKVEIGSLLQQLVGEYTHILNKQGLEVYTEIDDTDIFVNIDVEKIVRVLENLLTNAKKYSVDNSTVVIKLFKEDKYVVIAISNETQNIFTEDLEKIFERFYKVDKSRNDKDSSGLGLAIVKRIVELHNGEIKVDLEDNIIQFIVKLPL